MSIQWNCSNCGERWTGEPYCPKCSPTITRTAKPPPSILTEAAAIISGPRRESYGPVTKSFAALANVWSEILGVKLKEQLDDIDVAKLMIALKLMREANAHSRDNLVDICGYAALLEQLHNANPTKEPSK